MKCYFHPEEEAIYECTACGKPICADCMRFDDDDQVVCPACTLEAAVEFADEDTREYMEKMHRLQQQKREKKTLEDRLEGVNGWYLLIILLLIGVNIYFQNYIDRAGEPAVFDAKRFAQSGNPAGEMSYILAKIMAYANDHDGAFPEGLDELHPDYLELKPRILGTDDQYTYSVIAGPEGFILNLPRADRYGYRKLYATADGIIKIE